MGRNSSKKKVLTGLRKKSKLKLKKKIVKFYPQSQLLEQVHDAVVSTDLKGIITSWNNGAKKLFGYSAREALGKHISVLQPHDRKKFLRKEIFEPLKKKGFLELELPQRRKSGEIFYVHLSLSLLNDENGQRVGTIGFALDITKRKQMERDIGEARERAIDEKKRLEAVMEVLPTGVAIIDEKGGNIQANSAFEKVWGGPRPSARSVKDYAKYNAWWVDTGKPVKPKDWASAQAVKKGKTITDQLFEIQRFDGSRAFVLNSASPIHNAEGNITGSAVVIRDITQLRRAEDELRKLASVVQHSSEFVGLATLDGKIIFLNEAAIAMTGLPVEDIGQTHILQVVPEQFRGKVQNELLPALKNKGKWEGELQYLNIKTGKLTDVYATTFTICDPKTGEPLYLANTSLDITKHKQTEQLLREANERYELVLSGSQAAIWDWDIPGRKVVYSSQWKAMRGFSDDEIDDSERHWKKNIHPEDIPRVMASLQKHFKEKTPFFAEEYRIRRKDGSWIWIADRGVARWDANGSVIRMAGSETDITDRKQAEQELIKSRNQIQGIIDNTSALVYMLDLNERFLLVNKALADLLNSSPEKMIGKRRHEFMPKDDADRHEANDRKAIKAGKAIELEEYSRLKGRSITWLTTKFPLRDPNGEIYALAGITSDISARKQAEEELRRSREDLNRAQAVGKVGSWRLDVQKNILTWSDQNHLIFGIPKGTPMTYETFLSTIHPDDRDYVDKKWKAGLAGEDYDIEHRLLVDGRVKWVREKAYLEFDDKGELLGGFGITQDITDRKNAEREIKNLARFPAENPFPVLRILKDGTIQYSNAPGIVILDKWGCQVGEKVPEDWCKWVAKSLKSDQITIKGITCGDRIFSIAVTPITEAGYVNLYGRDITKQKQYEKELRNSRDELEIKVKQRTAELNQTVRTLQEEAERRLAAEGLVKIERQRFENVLEMMPAYAILLTPDYHVAYANRTFREWFGDDNGKKCYEFLFNRTEPCDGCETYKVLKTGKNHFWEWTGPNGRNYDIFDYPFKDTDGSPLIMEMGVDVTSHKQAQNALGQSEDRYRSLAVATTQIIWTTDAQGQVVGDMPSWRAFTGQSIEEIQGWGWINSLHPDDRERTAKIWAKSVQDKTLYETEYRIRRYDGQYRYVSVRGVPVLEQDGSIREWVGTCTDISERKQIEDRTRITNILLGLFAQKTSRKEYLDLVVKAICDWSSCQCAGIRLTNGDGYIPFESFIGFSDEFLAAENMLSLKNDTCLCIRVITQKRESPDIPLATPKGSFCSGDTFDFISKLPKNAKKLYRGTCMKHGFASLAVIPIRYRQQILGAIHLADEKKDMVGREKVELLENMAMLIGEAVHRFDVETELRESESRLSEAQRLAHLGNWEWDISKGKLWWSDEVYRIFGFQPQQFNVTYEAFLSYVHPDDRQAVKEAVGKALSHEGQYEIDHRETMKARPRCGRYNPPLRAGHRDRSKFY